MVDSNDRDRVDAARDELHRMLNEDELRESILLVFANKQVNMHVTRGRTACASAHVQRCASRRGRDFCRQTVSRLLSEQLSVVFFAKSRSNEI